MNNANQTIIEDQVRKEWVDYNGHMNDAAYAQVFSIACDILLRSIGLNTKEVAINLFSIFTLENYICYFREVKLDEPFIVRGGIVDFDIKRIQVFFIMENENKECLATSEQLLIGIDMTTRKAAPFPTYIQKNLLKTNFNFKIETKLSIRK